jgi:hypothetical protein
MGRSAVIHGLGELPAMNRQPVPGWAAALDQWWRLLESRGWGEPGLSEGAWFVMRTLRVPPAKVCEALLERVGSVSEVTLVGFGQNGRLLAEQAIGRGLRVYVRDDRYPDGLLPEPVARMGVIGEPIDAPATRPVVITPLDDSRLTPRFAECKPLRWHEMLMELARMSWSSETLEAELREQAESRCPGPWPASAPWPENMVAASARV